MNTPAVARATTMQNHVQTGDARDGIREAVATPRRIRVGMPHLDAGGLSENWLFRHAGDLHWEEISRKMRAATDEIRGVDGTRLYPTVVAARARYPQSLSSARENDVLAFSAQVNACGRSCAHGHVQAESDRAGLRFSIELLTTFAVRDASGGLRMALPAARLAARWTPLGTTDDDDVRPLLEISRLAKAARKGAPLSGDDFSGPSVVGAGNVLGSVCHEPSPYGDYNGAGLLYFAAYVTIADTAERKIVRELGLDRVGASAGTPPVDWALATSAVRRDVFYYGNLPLGETITAELLDCQHEPTPLREADATVKTRMRLRRESTGQPIADVVTRRALAGAGRG